MGGGNKEEQEEKVPEKQSTSEVEENSFYFHQVFHGSAAQMMGCFPLIARNSMFSPLFMRVGSAGRLCH